jgi:hypothetical protein
LWTQSTGALDKLTSLSRYQELCREQAQLHKQGIYFGIGMAAFLDKSGAGPSRALPKGGGIAGGYESATARVHSDGKVSLLVGCHSHGQSHETTFAAIAADRLGVPIDDIQVVEGDTACVQFGTWGSRSVSVGGAAICNACRTVGSSIAATCSPPCANGKSPAWAPALVDAKALPFRAACDGETVSGKFTATVQLSSGKFAIIEKAHEFTLVPWRPVIDRQLGREVTDVLQGGSVSWQLLKHRGIGF